LIKLSGVAVPHDQHDLERALAFLYQQWKLLGYRPVRFFRSFTPYCKGYKGGVLAVQIELRRSGPNRKSGGTSFEFLYQRRKEIFSLEYLVLKPTWSHLFTDEDRRIAQDRVSLLRGN
jgi:hypothetical protein